MSLEHLTDEDKEQVALLLTTGRRGAVLSALALLLIEHVVRGVPFDPRGFRVAGPSEQDMVALQAMAQWLWSGLTALDPPLLAHVRKIHRAHLAVMGVESVVVEMDPGAGAVKES